MYHTVILYEACPSIESTTTSEFPEDLGTDVNRVAALTSRKERAESHEGPQEDVVAALLMVRPRAIAAGPSAQGTLTLSV